MDVSPMWEQLQGMLDYVLILIPNLVIGLIIIAESTPYSSDLQPDVRLCSGIIEMG